jgi:hypothetical protein
MSDMVLKDICEERHASIKETVDDHATRLRTVEDAVLKLTIMVEGLNKKSIFDKVLIISVFCMSLALLAIVLGPEIAGKFIGGMVK